MTGNTKVWRAPLAGLAAVAMLATMGVAASTANAADQAPEFTVKFDLNGHGTTATPDSLKAQSDTNPADSYRVNAEWKTKSEITNPKDSDSSWVFTGWYTSAKLGEGERFNTQAPVFEDTTLYAHWAKSTDTVKFSVNPNGATLAYPDLNQDGDLTRADQTAIKLAPGDKLSAWMAPSDGLATDHRKVTGFTTQDGKAAFDFTQTLAAGTKTVSAKADWTQAGIVTLSSTSTDSTPGAGLQVSGEKAQFEVANGDSFDVPEAAYNGKLVENWTAHTSDPKTNNQPFASGSTLPTDENGNAEDVLLVAGFDGDNANDVDAKVVSFSYTPAAGQKVQLDNEPAQLVVSADEPLTLPVPNTYDGKLLFDGWYKGSQRAYDGDSFASLVDAATTSSVVLTGSFTVGNVQFTVTFDPNYTGSQPTEVKYADGATVAKPEDPTRDGYVFAGWQSNLQLTDSLGHTFPDSKVYKTADDFRKNVTAASGLTFKALWLTPSQAELQGLLDEKGAAYEDNQAWTDFNNKRNDIARKASYATDAATPTVDQVNGLSHVSEAAAKDYIKQLSDLKGKLSATNQKFVDVFNGNNGTVATPHSTEIEFVAKKGISTGYGDGTFKPTGSMFRQDYAAFLYRLAGSPEYTPAASDNIFTDVTPATPHYKEILWAAKQGIIKGFADGTFRGLALVNRQDAAAFLYRAAGSPEFDASKAAKTFTDVNESTPHYKEVLWAANTVVSQDYDGNGTTDSATAIIQGFQAGTFDGYATLLRQDGAAFLARTYFYINK